MNNSRAGKRTEAGKLADDSTLSVISDFIINVPLFQGFDPFEVGALARYFKLYYVEAGAVLFEEGEEGTFMGIIIEGRVQLQKQTAAQGLVTLSVEGAGRVLGEMALIDGEPRSATASFVQAGRMLILSRESFERVLREQPRLGFKLLFQLSRVLSRRLRRATGLLTDHMQPDTVSVNAT